jgi:hypothetical protein
MRARVPGCTDIYCYLLLPAEPARGHPRSLLRAPGGLHRGGGGAKPPGAGAAWEGRRAWEEGWAVGRQLWFKRPAFI